MISGMLGCLSKLSLLLSWHVMGDTRVLGGKRGSSQVKEENKGFHILLLHNACLYL